MTSATIFRNATAYPSSVFGFRSDFSFSSSKKSPTVPPSEVGFFGEHSPLMFKNLQAITAEIPQINCSLDKNRNLGTDSRIALRPRSVNSIHTLCSTSWFFSLLRLSRVSNPDIQKRRRATRGRPMRNQTASTVTRHLGLVVHEYLVVLAALFQELFRFARARNRFAKKIWLKLRA